VIAVDSSALVALALKEPDHLVFLELLQSRDCLIGTPTLLETHMVLNRSLAAQGYLAMLTGFPNIEVVPFGRDHLAAARSAFDRYGKGRHPKAALNFGDCMAYAVAKVRGVPLLFKGSDFLATDIEPALRP
jgi:ribonuclease VapC